MLSLHNTMLGDAISGSFVLQGVNKMDLHSLLAGVHVLCRAGDPETAQQMIDGMWSRGMDPGVQVWLARI